MRILIFVLLYFRETKSELCFISAMLKIEFFANIDSEFGGCGVCPIIGRFLVHQFLIVACIRRPAYYLCNYHERYSRWYLSMCELRSNISLYKWRQDFNLKSVGQAVDLYDAICRIIREPDYMNVIKQMDLLHRNYSVQYYRVKDLCKEEHRKIDKQCKDELATLEAAHNSAITPYIDHHSQYFKQIGSVIDQVLQNNAVLED